MKIKIKKVHPLAQLPVRADEGCGGWDVIATEIIKQADDFYVCKLGLKMQPESPNYKITLVPRSSLTKTNWILQNSPALGDWSFTGEYELRFRAIPQGLKGNTDWGYSLKYPEFPFKVGDRIGQIYLEEVIPIKFDESTELIETSRGAGGFGSTGK
jgi:dUTP pyrophosphatase